MSLCKIILSLMFCFLVLSNQGLKAESKLASSCQRIISLAPSVTEMLFALDLGTKVVAVTRYCKFPREAEALPQIGGLFDTNLEAGILLAPDLVLGLKESVLMLSNFKNFGVNSITVSDRSIDDIYESLLKICLVCGCKENAESLVVELKKQVVPWVKARENKKIISVALVVASTISSGVEELYLSGKDGFYSSILEMINARNVFLNTTAVIPSSSFETLATLAPEIIFILEASSLRFEHLQESLKLYLPNAKVIQLKSDYASIPGPRFPLLLRDLVEGMQSTDVQLGAGEGH